MTTANTFPHNNQTAAGFPPAPPEAHQRAVRGADGSAADALLLNLARRLKMARQTGRAFVDAPEGIRQFSEGAILEAWNSYQAAKAVVYEARIAKGVAATQAAQVGA